MRFAFIHTNRMYYPIVVLCRVLEVSRSGYYAWRVRPMSATSIRREELAEVIREAHADNREVYGSPRIFRELLSKKNQVLRQHRGEDHAQDRAALEDMP